jgi:hypothetical protein
MRKIFLCGLSLVLWVTAYGQENPKKDIPIQKKTKQPPDTSFKNPIYEGPAEIDSINRTDSLNKGKRVPIDRYREDSIPRSPKKGILY